jgi:hypothetical protein
MTRKFICVEYRGYAWDVPLVAVATHRARHYAERDKDTTFDDEYQFVMDDHAEGLDWFLNNMDWDDVADVSAMVSTPEVLTRPKMGAAESHVVERP